VSWIYLICYVVSAVCFCAAGWHEDLNKMVWWGFITLMCMVTYFHNRVDK
jgi:hypothetical protein